MWFLDFDLSNAISRIAYCKINGSCSIDRETNGFGEPHFSRNASFNGKIHESVPHRCSTKNMGRQPPQKLSVEPETEWTTYKETEMVGLASKFMQNWDWNLQKSSKMVFKRHTHQHVTLQPCYSSNNEHYNHEHISWWFIMRGLSCKYGDWTETE